VKKYLDYLRQNPHYQKKFFIDSDGIRHVFETHDQLDKWHKENLFFFDTKEKEFLKGFHRAFQLVEASKIIKKQEINDNSENQTPDLAKILELCIVGNPTV